MVKMKTTKCPSCGGTVFKLAGKASKLCHDECLDCRRKALQANQPRRCETNIVGAIGECLACDAEQGVACQSTRRDGPVLREGVAS